MFSLMRRVFVRPPHRSVFCTQNLPVDKLNCTLVLSGQDIIDIRDFNALVRAVAAGRIDISFR